jgi:hypothetical protein
MKGEGWERGEREREERERGRVGECSNTKRTHYISLNEMEIKRSIYKQGAERH